MSQVYTWPSQSVTATNPSVGINNTPAPAQSTQVAGQDALGDLIPLLVDANGQLQVEVTGSVLPSGAATAANQATEIASLASIDSKLTSPLAVTGPLTDAQLRASAVPVSAASLPLPTGAATAANQATEIASLASIDSKLTAPLAITAASLPLPTGAATETTLAAAAASLVSIDGKLTAPVAVTGPLTDTQLRASAVPVSIAASPSPSGRSVVSTVRTDYVGSPVTTGAWVQLIASTASTINMIEIFDSSGQTMELGLGAAASEVRLILVFPGGNGQVPVTIPSGSRLSVRAVSATANAGEQDLNLYS